LNGSVAVHFACHARAQNMGPKAADLLRLIPEADLTIVERCSGHGGSWGVMRENFEVGVKIGRPVARQALESQATFVASECPLAADHIVQGMSILAAEQSNAQSCHPIELLARAYGIDV